MSEPLDLEKLRALAEKATSGEWRVGLVPSEGPLNRVHAPSMLVAICENAATNDLSAFDAAWEPHFDNAAFIAAANPQTVLALLSRLQECEKALTDAKEELEYDPSNGKVALEIFALYFQHSEKKADV